MDRKEPPPTGNLGVLIWDPEPRAEAQVPTAGATVCWSAGAARGAQTGTVQPARGPLSALQQAEASRLTFLLRNHALSPLGGTGDTGGRGRGVRGPAGKWSPRNPGPGAGGSKEGPLSATQMLPLEPHPVYTTWLPTERPPPGSPVA